MRPPTDQILAEIPDVAQIVSVACSEEAARRGAPVDPHDVRVQERAADIILNGAGASRRRRHSGERSVH